jgi:GT2 family glycosyltransferase/glycosyltransferase involved in cell wall biosynthesis
MANEANLLRVANRALRRALRIAIGKKFYMDPKNIWLAHRIGTSRLFDRDWYLRNYPDISRRGVDPIVHFLKYGAQEGRNPGPDFDTEWYCRQYPDVAQSKYNPLLHHLLVGERLGRATTSAGGQPIWWQGVVGQVREDWGALSIPVEVPTIIVPVYNAVDELKACVASVLRNSGTRYRLILINDASPDPEVTRYLSTLEGQERLEVHHNKHNLGFTRTINRGIELAGRADVILLNSDTEVTPGWIQNLRLAVYSAPKIASASPFSNNAGAFSAPNLGEANQIPTWLDRDAWGRTVTQTSERLYPRVPTTHGFCMYIRRDCLDAVGALDAEAFPRGYGEENDFCMRAGRAGWEHVVDDATLVYHVRSASFGEAKTGLMAEGRKVIDSRYPEYKKEISVFSTPGEVSRARENVRRALSATREAPERVLPRILYVLSTRTGGTPQTNQDLMGALGDVAETLVLRCDARRLSLQLFREGRYFDLEKHELSRRITAFPHTSEEYDGIVRAWMIKYSIELLHVRHIAWHSLGLMTEARMLGIPIAFSFHDFYTICPTVKLLDENASFCGGVCTASKGECQHELWDEPDFPALKNRAIQTWQQRFAEALKLADMLITTSPSAREIILARYPELDAKRFVVIPHGRDFPAFHDLAPEWKRGEPLRILVPGNISIAKGGALLKKMLDQAPKGAIELHVMGNIANDTGLRRTVIDHGTYHRSEFARIVREIRPHIGAVFSIWPETYCHTLTEMWSCGIPVVGVDFGAVAERIRENGAGWIVDHTDEDNLWKRIEAELRRPGELARKRQAALDWQEGEGLYSTTELMAARYFLLYGMLIGEPRPATDEFAQILVGLGNDLQGQIIPTICPSESKIRGQASTYVRVWERTRNRLGSSTYYLRSTPQELVALAHAGICPIAIVQRNAIPLDGVGAVLDCVEEGKLAFLHDLDDDLLHVPADKDPKGVYAAYAPPLRGLLAKAACVTVSVPTLCETLKPFCGRTELLPNQLSRSLWGASPAFARSESKLVRTLYMGTKTHDADLEMIRPALEKVARDFPGFRLKVIGGLATPWTVKADWLELVELEDDVKAYPRFVHWFRKQCSDVDFALAPMVEQPFNRNKSGLKFLDYAGVGLSGLFSDMPVYAEMIALSGCGRTVPADGWEDALRRALANPAPLWGDGLRAREWVKDTQMYPGQLENVSEIKG